MPGTEQGPFDRIGSTFSLCGESPELGLTMRKRALVFVAMLVGSLGILIAPKVWIDWKYDGQIYANASDVPVHHYGVVLGAKVNADYSLSDAAKERIEAGVRLYSMGRVSKLYVSGDNRNNLEAETIARYAIERGVPEDRILIDRLGIDTQDTCRHFSALASTGILLTQEFHLPRSLLMCGGEGVTAVGVAVNRLDILSVRGNGVVSIYSVRSWRYFREAMLTWSFLLGLYERMSNEAELVE